MSEDIPLKTCAICQATESLKACASCYSTWYCSRQHQIQDWKYHRPQCNKHAEVRVNDIASDMAGLGVYSTQPAEHHVTAAESGEHDNPNDHLADAHTIGRSLPGDLPSHITRSWLLKVAGNITSCLNKFGIAVINGLLGQDLGDKILNEAKSLHDRHLMTDGQTIMHSSSEGDSHSKQKYRMDKISWVNGVEGDCQNVGTLVTLIDTVMQHVQLKFTQYKIQGRTKAMVACYPGRGSRYVKHVDNPSSDGRLLTCIYYLNKDWNCTIDGGMLRIYPQGSSQVACVEPVMDRLLVFWSDKRNPHEVMPAYRTRFAVTTWYFDAKERMESRKREANKQMTSSSVIDSSSGTSDAD